MPELSNLLKNGLARASQEAGVHPDADLLTAYAEQRLPAAERDQLMVHLAACGECREVVYMMMEPVAAEEAAVVLLPEPRRRWFLTPQFGFVAAVATMAVGIGIFLRVQHMSPAQNPPAQEAKAAPPAAIKPGSGEEDSRPAKPAPTAPERTDRAASAPASGRNAAVTATTEARNAPVPERSSRAPAPVRNETGTRKKEPAEPVQIASATPVRQDYVNLERFSSDAAYQTQSGAGELPSAPLPAGNASNLAQARILADNVQPQVFADIPKNAVKQGQNGLAFYQPPSPRQSVGIGGKIVDLGKDVGKRFRQKQLAPAISQEALSFAMAAKAPAIDQSAEAVPTAPAEKTDASSLRGSSAFSGRARGAVSSGDASARLSEASAPRWKVESGKLYRSINAGEWTEFPAASGVEFSVVTAKGAEVWAGGRHAAVLHSADRGANWEKISLGETASGTVLTIDVNGDSVVVKTSANQTWTSLDGGKSWMLR